MRGLSILLSTVLMAQAPSPKPQAAGTNSTTTKAATAKSAASQSSGTKINTAPERALITDDDKTIYALGLSIYRSLSQFDLSPNELELVKRALTDAAAGKPAEDLNTWGPKIQSLARTRAARVEEREKAESKAYLAKAATEPGAVKTASGLVYRELRPGSGPSPKATDTVKVNYRGRLINGTEFDSSYARNQPAQFALSGVIRCWTEGVQMMKVGGKAVLVCPSELAYGDRGRPSIPGGAALIFEVELLEIAGSTASPAK
jgi:FKBP-type peptidyl-prolyl cis-trans isomerase FkpA